jgi:thiol:disulfide interchange protein
MRLTLFFTLLFASLNIFADQEIPPRPVKTGIQFYKGSDSGFIALNFENHPKWHTYWKNPGDAGLPVKNIFSVAGSEIKLTEEEWPAPKRYIEEGNLWAFGYEGNYTFFFRLSKADINNYAGKDIELKSTWLVCKHICIPGQQIIQFKIASDSITSSTPDLLPPLESAVLAERFNALPKSATIPPYLDLKLSKGKAEKTLVLTYTVKGTVDVSHLKDTNLIYAFPQIPFDVLHENIEVADSSLKGITVINWDGEYTDPPQDFPKDGKFKRPYTLKFLFTDPIQKKVSIIEKKFERFDLNEVAAPAVATDNNSSGVKPATDGSTTIVATSTNSLFYYLILAFLGGLILNIMPCVLPVISIKLFGLVKYKNESRKTILRHNLFYTLGILFTFAVLATIVLSLKSIGSQVGWGFQLQSPGFIAVMIIGLFIFALNLFGVFEFSTPGGKKLGNVETKEGFTGDFLSGVLATVLSTPCSAPFLGTALTFAFTSSTSEIYLIFTMIGLGLAFPFILTAVFPALVSFLPRPGNWMNTVKKLLGLTLILTNVWLLDVYNALVDGSSQLIKLAAILVFIFAGFLLVKKDKWVGAVSFLLALGLFVNISSTQTVSSTEETTALIRDKQAKGLNWQPWSEARMSEHKMSGEAVFIDFTAKWCFTCKVNEKLVLETDDFKKLVAEKNLKLLIGDWTKRDEVIGSFLRKNGLVGVPAYFVQKKDGTLVNLGETITIGRIREHLD